MDGLVSQTRLGVNFKILITPIVVILSVFLVFVFFLPGNISKINKKIEDYKLEQSKEKVLNEKLESLRKISPDQIDPEDITVIALPSKNPPIWVISQARNLSKELDIEINEITSEKDEKSENLKASILKIEISSDDYTKILSFLNSLVKILPLSFLSSLDLTYEDLGVYNVSLNLFSYWSDFPENLPPIDKPINELTDDDLNMIKSLSDYKKPLFIELSPQEPREVEMPFF